MLRSKRRRPRGGIHPGPHGYPGVLEVNRELTLNRNSKGAYPPEEVVARPKQRLASMLETRVLHAVAKLTLHLSSHSRAPLRRLKVRWRCHFRIRRKARFCCSALALPLHHPTIGPLPSGLPDR